MSNVSYYTAEGLKKLRGELKQLKDVERIKASRHLKVITVVVRYQLRTGDGLGIHTFTYTGETGC